MALDHVVHVYRRLSRSRGESVSDELVGVIVLQFSARKHEKALSSARIFSSLLPRYFARLCTPPLPQPLLVSLRSVSLITFCCFSPSLLLFVLSPIFLHLCLLLTAAYSFESCSSDPSTTNICLLTAARTSIPRSIKSQRTTQDVVSSEAQNHGHRST